MSRSPAFNTRNAGVKRLMQELREMQANPSPDCTASPLEDDLFEWHFTIRGPADSPYQGGRYHGRLLFPPEYPFKPPNIIILTPNGRFEVEKKICLSMSAYHPELWQPSWSIRTVLVALIGFFPTPGNGAIGAIELSEDARTRLAHESLDWECPKCKSHNRTALPEITPGEPAEPHANRTSNEQQSQETDESETLPPTSAMSPFPNQSENTSARNTQEQTPQSEAGSEPIPQTPEHKAQDQSPIQPEEIVFTVSASPMTTPLKQANSLRHDVPLLDLDAPETPERRDGEGAESAASSSLDGAASSSAGTHEVTHHIPASPADAAPIHQTPAPALAQQIYPPAQQMHPPPVQQQMYPPPQQMPHAQHMPPVQQAQRQGMEESVLALAIMLLVLLIAYLIANRIATRL